jgi:hypothetical protein
MDRTLPLETLIGVVIPSSRWSRRDAKAPTEALFGYIMSAVSLLTRHKEVRMGAAVIAVIVRRERELVELFTREGATSPVAAKTLQELNIDDHGVAMRRLRNRAVVREAGGRYYVDLESWEAFRRTRQRMALVLALIVLAFAVAVALGVFKTAT